MTSSASFASFAFVASELAQEPSRLKKSALLAGYFETLGDDDLILAARYFSGSPFAGWDERVLGLGGQTVLKALSLAFGRPDEALKSALVELGDLGKLAQSVCPEREASAQTLKTLEQALGQLVALKGPKKRFEALARLLGDASPLEACFLVKITLCELRIGLMEGALEDAIARHTGASLDAVKRCNMWVGDIGETALRARHKTLEQAPMRLFHGLKFMLATAIDTTKELIDALPERFAAEDKFDGIRAQVHIGETPKTEVPLRGLNDGAYHIALFSRTQADISASFTDLIAALGRFAADNDLRDCILDGEIVPVAGDEILPFARLQTRLGRKMPSEALMAAHPVAFVAYDLLWADKTLFLEKPFWERRARLQECTFATAEVRLAESPILTGEKALDEAFTEARLRGNEGLVLKSLEAPYRPGKRGREWLKMKRPQGSLDVVVVSVERGHGRRSKWYSDYTFAVRTSETDPTLLNVGKAYSGLTDSEVQELDAWFRAHTVASFGHDRVRTVEPLLVLEITFDRVQVSARHKSGYALRFPRIVRIRHDKPASEADTVQSVARFVET